MKKHSPIGFSGAERWLACPGSVRISESLARVSTSYADEGSAAHYLGEVCLKGDLDASKFRGCSIFLGPKPSLVEPSNVALIERVTGGWLPHFEVGAEMISGVNLYCETVRADREPGDVLDVEVRFHIPQLHPKLFGTADARLYRPSTRALRVYDLKYGAGIQVEVEENEQEIGYALGAVYEKPTMRVRDVEVIIVQPRAAHVDGPVRRWQTDAVELLDWAETFREGAARTDEPDAPLVPGEHCRFCPGAAVCPALNEMAQIAVVDTYKAGGYDPEMLADSLDRARALKHWLKSVEQFALNEANLGRTPPRHKLVNKRAIRAWMDEQEATRMLLGDGITEAEIIQPAKLKSPAGIEDVIGRKRFADLVAEHVSAVSSGVTLAPETDNRPAVYRNTALDFQPVEPTEPYDALSDMIIVTDDDPLG